MNFPISTLNEVEYNDKLKELIFAEDAKLFFDTNLFSQLFKIYPDARAEFYNWVDPEIARDRICISSWSMNEYVSRFITNKLNEYTGDIRKIKTIKAELSNVRDFLKMYIDDRNLIGTAFANRDEYFAELDLVVDKFEKIANATKEVNDYWNIMNAELGQRFEKAILPSNIYSIIQDIQSEAEIRMQNRIPPGYKDDQIRSENKYGDLIIWKEILNYCKGNGITKVVFVSNDGKKDFVYKPQKIIRGGKEIQNDSYQLPDPRLVYEFKQYTGSNDLYIVKFATLVQFLWDSEKSKFDKLSKAIQLSEINKVKAKAEKNSDETNSTTISQHTVSVVEPSESSTEIAINASETIDSPSLDDSGTAIADTSLHSTITDYSQNAIADGEFEPATEVRLSEILRRLKTYTWDIQNSGMDMLSNTPLNFVPDDQVHRDYFFVLGRNLYQAACGNAFRAIEFVTNIPGYLKSIPSSISSHIVNGLFFEIYFDFKGEFRNGNFKVGFIEDVFSLQTMPAYRTSIAFIRNALEPFRDRLVIQPNTTAEIANVTITHEPAPKDERIVAKHVLIVDIRANGKGLLSEKNDVDNPDWNSDLKKYYYQDLIPKLSTNFAIPPDQIVLTFNPPLHEEKWIFSLPEGKTFGISQ